MAKTKKSKKKPIEQYDHKGKKRPNNPPVGLVTPDTDKESGKKTYKYDPHIDPSLQWAGKAEHTSFDVPTVSLHVHERIDTRTVVETVRKRNGNGGEQLSLFQTKEENPPIREAIEFYKHRHNWSNRLIAGDSLLVMNSLIEKEGLAGQVQMIYLDPPYGIKYGSNFQPFVNKRDVKDGKDEDLTQEPETIKAFRDTWELGIHSYLTYLRDRLLLARELLTESGSVFVQMNAENLHWVNEIVGEIFGTANFVSIVSFATTTGFQSKALARAGDYLIWYAKDIERLKYRQLFTEAEKLIEQGYRWIRLPNGTMRALTVEEIRGKKAVPTDAELYNPDNIKSQGATHSLQKFEYKGKVYTPGQNSHWKTTIEGMYRLAKANRIHVAANSLRYVRLSSDSPVKNLNNIWTDTVTGQFTDDKVYAVQTNTKVIERCILMATDPGNIVFDPTCGSGSTAYVAEQWGRRWITCDTSRVSITLAKQRLMTALFDYYELAHPDEGVGSGLKYKTVPHVTLKSIANNEPPGRETLYDQPFMDKTRARVTGPFTVEAVPAPVVKPLSECHSERSKESSTKRLFAGAQGDIMADESVTRSGETLHQAEWRDELLRCGIRGKAGQHILFSRVEPLAGTRWLHADAETKPNDAGADSVKESESPYGQPQRAVISFGPEHAPLEQRQVALAIEEAQTLVPKPKIIIFASFQFDPEAAKDIDETDWPGVMLLKVQMNADLFTGDLKKKRASNESFWLIGQPDVQLEKIKDGNDKGKYRVEVLGFDYYNTKTGNIDSGGTNRIAMWMLDTDYDGRSLFPRQIFFPMSGEKDGWSRLAKHLKAEIDEEQIEAYRGTVSLPFEPGENKRIAVKIIDDRGIESLKFIDVE